MSTLLIIISTEDYSTSRKLKTFQNFNCYLQSDEKLTNYILIHKLYYSQNNINPYSTEIIRRMKKLQALVFHIGRIILSKINENIMEQKCSRSNKL